DVRDAVRAEPGELLDHPPLAVAEQVRRDAEQGPDLGGPLDVRGVSHLDPLEWGGVGRTWGDGGRQVNDPHRAAPRGNIPSIGLVFRRDVDARSRAGFPAEESIQSGEEAVPLDRFADEVIAAQSQAFFPIVAHGVRGDGDDRGREAPGTEPPYGLIA